VEIDIALDELDVFEKGQGPNPAHKPETVGPCAISAVDWSGTAIAFGTRAGEVLLLPRIKALRSPHRVATAVEDAEVVAAAVHPGGGRILTLTTAGVLQVWSTEARSLVQEVGLPTSCHILHAESLEVAHTISYKPARETSVSAARFSPGSDCLALGTQEGGVDVFDVYGRRSFAKWITKLTDFEVAEASLEIECMDGVVLAKLIQELQESISEGLGVVSLRFYALEVEIAPHARAYKNRPRTYDKATELLEEGMRLCETVSLKAIDMLEVLADNILSSLGPAAPGTSLKAIDMLDVLAGNMLSSLGPAAPGSVLQEHAPANRENLFAFLAYLRCFDFVELDDVTLMEDRKRRLESDQGTIRYDYEPYGKATS
ncbi:hypothetical protein T484DRAFT_1783342, partial [Baffinella frigidus]